MPAQTPQEQLEAIRSGYLVDGLSLDLGAAVDAGAAHPDVPVRIPLSAMNRHGLVAGATGTGKTKTLQLLAGSLATDDGFTLDELKTRYKVLAKKHHPDLNGGDKASEERLKLVIEAYTYLKDERLYV